ncbi:MAG: lipopolysaccharide heptosyltransferase I [Candidatus Sumerlaeota bacterium]|nr:lipopolysaccharide heptosyltransferase I [Candidatus Sumerlaeota bacterium]
MAIDPRPTPIERLPPPQRILIVRLSAIGDVVHALPALRLLRGAFPKAALGWVVEDFASAFLENHPDLDALHVIPKRRWRGAFWRSFAPEMRPFFQALRRRRYDVAIDFQGLTKSGLVAWLSGAPRRIGFGDRQGAELSKLFTNWKVTPPSCAAHVIERNVALLSPLGIHAPPPTPHIPLPETDLQKAEAIWTEWNFAPGERVAGLNVGAGWPTKRWPTRHWAELASLLSRRLQARIVFLWGTEAERAMAADAHALALANGVSALLAPPTSLREQAALLRRLALYYGGDTGATHVAAALGVATVGLYGASDAVRNGPYWRRSIALQVRSAGCIPCWKKECRYARRLACLEDLTPRAALDAGEKLLEGDAAL